MSENVSNADKKDTDGIARGGEDWKRRGLAPGFVITPDGHVIHLSEWDQYRKRSKKRTASDG